MFTTLASGRLQNKCLKPLETKQTTSLGQLAQAVLAFGTNLLKHQQHSLFDHSLYAGCLLTGRYFKIEQVIAILDKISHEQKKTTIHNCFLRK